MKPTHRIRLRTAIIAIILIAAVASSVIFAGAIWKEEDSVHINPDDIENSTLVIGTHLIHISALTQSIYDVAEKSAEDSGQSNMYYKSELADGTWFDISTANSLSDITTNGTPVDKSVIAALFFTHHTKSDGVTYDLRTNAAVSIFDINNPYDISTMDELLPLKTQYDKIVEGSGKNAVSKRIEKILTVKISDDYTNDLDSKLKALNEYAKVLSDNDGGAKEQEAVQKVMESVDADRRAYVFTAVEKLLNEYLDELGTPPPAKDNTAESSSDNTSLLSAVTESVKNVEDSFIKYDGLKLTAGTTVYQTVRYKYSTELITNAKDSNHSACDTDVANLISLENIMNDTISDKTKELNLLNSDLLGEATKRFSEALKLGETADYKAQVANNAASVVLKNIISTNTSTINSYRNELEFLVSAYCSRVGNDDSLSFIDTRIALTKTYYSLPPYDAFFESTTSTVDAHMDYLTKKRQSILSANGGDELTKLKAEKADLQTQMRSALDKNDLDGAKNIENQISDLDKQIEDLENEASDKLSELQSKVSDLEKQLKDAQDAGNADLANKLLGELGEAKGNLSSAASGMSDGSLGNQIELLKQDGLTVVNADTPSGEDLTRLNTDIDALIDLIDLNPKQVFAALTALYNEMAAQSTLDSTSAFDPPMAKIKEAIKNNADSYSSALQDEKSGADLEKIANNFLSGNVEGSKDLLDSGLDSGEGSGGGSAGNSSGVTLPNLSREELLSKFGQEIYLLALQSYYDETGSGEALGLISSTAQNLSNLGKQTVYIHMKQADAEYIPLSAIHSYSGMRYVEKDGGMTATLAQGANYYTFTVYSDAVTIGKNSSNVEYMPKASAYQSGIHICENYSYSKFGVQCVYLSNTQFAVLCTDQLQSLADELFALFLS